MASHACKGKVRYRYYVSRALQHSPGDKSEGLRIPAREIESAVVARIAEALDDPIALLDKLGTPLESHTLQDATTKASALAEHVRKKERVVIRSITKNVRVFAHEVRIEISAQMLMARLGLGHIKTEQQTVELVSPVRLKRNGMAMRLVHINGKAAAPQSPDAALIRLLLKARTWWKRLSDGTADITTLAREEGINDSWITRVVRLNFLAPTIVAAILDGNQPVQVNADSLVKTGGLPINWREQIAMINAI